MRCCWTRSPKRVPSAEKMLAGEEAVRAAQSILRADEESASKVDECNLLRTSSFSSKTR